MTLLPEDPDRSARAIRARLAELLDLPPERTPAIVISDSFGRPWRWGIVDVALGVAGFGPLDDQRGRPDTAGRVMRSTVVAVADEIASAAELASGKTSGRPGRPRPWRRACRPATGRSSGEMIMPTENDLFP